MPRVAPCRVCGEPCHLGGRSSETPKHRACIEHGSVGGYQRGCRCAECRKAKLGSMRAYIAKVIEREGISPRVKYRKTPDVFCAECGNRLRSGGGGTPSGVTPRCLRCSRGRRRITPAVRLAVHERDGWLCQLCGELTEPDSDQKTPWYPTLDHIVAVSLGGTDEPDNLRTAHRWCNGVRGVNDPHGLFAESR